MFQFGGRDPEVLAACVLAAAHNASALNNVDSRNIAAAALDIYDALDVDGNVRANLGAASQPTGEPT